MKFKYVGPNATDEEGQEIPANCYGGNKLMNGDVVDLGVWLSEKAKKNPNYEKHVKPKKQEPKKEEVKKTKEDLFGVSAKDKQ
jgi:hypothetical protein